MIQVSPFYSNAVICNDEKSLQDIHLRSKNIAVYQRDIEPLSKRIRPLVEQEIKCRASGTVNEILPVLKDYFTNNLSEYSPFLDDISKLLRLFERLTESSSFRLTLTTVSTDMCRKFHTDINDLRLLCTYVGQGTLWLPDEIINRKVLQTGGNDQEIVMDEKQIQQVSTGEVVILKGALFPEADPILHRSPSIEGNREKRLLLRIDTNESIDFFK